MKKSLLGLDSWIVAAEEVSLQTASEGGKRRCRRDVQRQTAARLTSMLGNALKHELRTCVDSSRDRLVRPVTARRRNNVCRGCGVGVRCKICVEKSRRCAHAGDSALITQRRQPKFAPCDSASSARYRRTLRLIASHLCALNNGPHVSQKISPGRHYGMYLLKLLISKFGFSVVYCF